MSESIIFNFLSRFYDLKNGDVRGCRLIAIHCYGLDRENQLPDATLKTVNMAIDIAMAQQEAPVMFVDSNYFGAGMQERENQLKMNIFKERKFPEQFVISFSEGIRNSIEEIVMFRTELVKRELLQGPVVLICDRSHARRLRLIWKKISPETTIVFKTVDGLCSPRNRVYIQRYKLLWLVANMVHHFLMLLPGGLNLTRQITHPIENRKI